MVAPDSREQGSPAKAPGGPAAAAVAMPESGVWVHTGPGLADGVKLGTLGIMKACTNVPCDTTIV